MAFVFHENLFLIFYCSILLVAATYGFFFNRKCLYRISTVLLLGPLYIIENYLPLLLFFWVPLLAAFLAIVQGPRIHKGMPLKQKVCNLLGTVQLFLMIVVGVNIFFGALAVAWYFFTQY